jgi:cobalamin biosynthesis protein CobD/CbiB
MLSPMPLYLLSVCAIYAFCLLKLVFAAMDAPIGYEDPKGFHYGLETARVDDAV